MNNLQNKGPGSPVAAKPARPAGLCAVVYVSKASRPVSRSDLMHILDAARRRNLDAGITGVLLYSDGAFMQYLEGPADELLKVYGIIKAHPLHYGLIDLVREPIERREFAEWSMACHVDGEPGDSSLTENFPLLAERIATALRPKSVAGELLSKFWTEGRASIANALASFGKARSQLRWPLDFETGLAD
jgi:hypothetical protein